MCRQNHPKKSVFQKNHLSRVIYYFSFSIFSIKVGYIDNSNRNFKNDAAFAKPFFCQTIGFKLRKLIKNFQKMTKFNYNTSNRDFEMSAIL